MSAFEQGWKAGIEAAVAWHRSRAKQALIQARRDRFPKRAEQEAELHEKSAEQIGLLSVEDV